MFDRSKLVDVIQKYGILTAPEGQEFTLASGAKSKFYIDFSRVVMVPEGAAMITEAVVDMLPQDGYDSFGGPSAGADPIVGAVMANLHIYTAVTGKKVRGFTIRKEPKGRGPGSGDMYEGYLEPGDRVILVEDVTTSGGSVLKAIKVVEDRGAKVVKVITLLDRLAGATEKLKDYDFVALTTLKDLKW